MALARQKTLDDLYQHAIRNEHDKLFRLLHSDANKHRITPSDLNLILLEACRMGNVHCVIYLLDFGAELNVDCSRCVLSKTPLHVSCLHGKLNCVRLLIARGADVDAETSSHETPLHFACMDNHVECAAELVNNDASIDIRDKWHHTPYDIACMFESRDCADFLHYARWGELPKEKFTRVL